MFRAWQLRILKCIAFLVLLLEVAFLAITVFTNEHVSWGDIGGSFCYILLFSASFFMLMQIDDKNFVHQESNEDDKDDK